jgi:DUF971 family protein
MAGGGADPTEPVDIRYDNARARLEIDWADGAATAYRYEFLRWKCPCAECAGEMGMPGRMQFVDALAPDQFRLSSIEGVGNYAVRPTWADGHDTGLYTLRTLRGLGDAAAVDIEAAAGIDGPRGRP